MSRGRHRVETVRKPVLRLPSALAPRLVAAGVGVAVVGLASGISLRMDDDSGTSTTLASAIEDGRGNGAMVANALQAAPPVRASDRASRNRAASTPTPSASSASPSVTPSGPPAVTGRLWTTERVNIRSGPSADDARLGSLEAGVQIGITGTTQDGWNQVVSDGRAGWVRSSYLSESKPKPQPEPKPASAPSGVSDAACSISASIESHLASNARAVYRAVCDAFGSSVSSFGGYRAGDNGDHGSGRAVDIMVSGDPGWDIARYVQAHARELRVTYVIYQQKIWMAGNPTTQWKLMENRGSRTANHYDHVHVSVS